MGTDGDSAGTCWVVVSHFANGKQTASKPMSYFQAYGLWERKNSRSKRRFSIRKVA